MGSLKPSDIGSKPEGPEEVPVLIIGAGPVGLLCAVLLTRLGVKVLVLEKYTARLTAPKAHAVGPRALDIFRQAGVNVEELRRQGTVRSEGCSVGIVTSLAGEELRTFPYERTDAAVLSDTPEMLHNVPQPNVERLLERTLESSTEIRRGHMFLGCVNGKSHVDTQVEDRATGRVYTIRCQFLLACDGSRSKVRGALGLECDNETTTEMLMTIEITSDLTGVVKDRRRILYTVLDPEAHGVLIAYDLSHKQVMIHNFDPLAHPIGSWNEQKCRKLVEIAIGRRLPFTVDSFRPWALQRKVASDYRRGRCFLVGDAAHSFPPSAGIGLNTGFGDAHNVAYKIAAVLRGWASDRILDTYYLERRPVVDVNSSQSVANGLRLHGLVRALGLDQEDPKVARERIKHFMQGSDGGDSDASKSLDALRANFNNLNLHIGYVYGANSPETKPSDYQPRYVPGARLPHQWIRPLNSTIMNGRPPVSLDYVHELSSTEKELRQYSTLDLCSEGHFTIISNTPTIQDVVCETISYCKRDLPTLPLRCACLNRDFEFVLQDKSRDWLENFHLGRCKHGAVLVRPDQHILRIWEECPSPKELADVLFSYLM